jgi:hypothetical protein
MMSAGDREQRAYRPGEKVPASGIYTTVHFNHRDPHEVVAIQGEEFPPCRQCKTEVRFYAVHRLPHMTHDFDLTGPNLRPAKRRAKAAGEEGGA